MNALDGKTVVVIGGTGGVGRHIVDTCRRNGALVTVVARHAEALKTLEMEGPGITGVTVDATDEAAIERLLKTVRPDLLILAAGSTPPSAPIHQMTWEQFSGNWEGDTRMAFNVCTAALKLPLAPAAKIIVISSGAALGGSPTSGGYASAKRAQLFIVSYCQKESDRLGLDLRFAALAPRMMPATPFGHKAVAGYADYYGISEDAFIERMGTIATAQNVADAVLAIATDVPESQNQVYAVSEKGMEAVN